MIKTQKGFTLIELMIVVAIIGILAAIAIPNFLRFQAKSKQAEAKTNLGAVGTTAEAFRAEYDSYVTPFTNLGWKEQGSCRYHYFWNYGTAETYACGTSLDATCTTAPNLLGASDTSFTAGAAGQIDKDATCDMWTYNDLRVLNNQVNDVSTP